MASSWVQSTAITKSPSGVDVASQCSPSLENDSLEIISLFVLIVIPSTSSSPFSRHATASYEHHKLAIGQNNRGKEIICEKYEFKKMIYMEYFTHRMR